MFGFVQAHTAILWAKNKRNKKRIPYLTTQETS